MINKKDIQLIIPMAGIGKRFLDAGYTTHKSLLEVDKQPIIKQIIDMFPGIEDIKLICNEGSIDEIQETIDRHCDNVCGFIRIPQHKKGPVWTVNEIFSLIDDNKPVIISYCDCISYFDFDKWIESIGDLDGSLLANRGFHPVMLGNDSYAVCFHEDNGLSKVIEKCYLSPEGKFKEFNSTGVYYFSSGAIVKRYFQKLIDLDINIKGEYYVSMVYNLMIEDGLKSNIFEVDNVVNLGVPMEYEEYKQISDYFWKNNNQKLKYSHGLDTTLVLPMAGLGSRFQSETDIPKPLIEVDNLPMFVKSVESAPRCENKVFIVLRHHVNSHFMHKRILEYYPRAKILILEKLSEGQAQTLNLGIKDLDLEKPILISACDYSMDSDANQYFNLVEDTKNDVIAFSFKNVQTGRLKPNSYAWMDVDENNYLKKLHCKHFPFDNPSKYDIFMGTAYFRKAKYFIDAYNYNIQNNIKTNGEFYLDDMLNTCINQGLKVKVFQCNHYNCFGTPQDLKVYNYWKDYFRKKFNI